MLKEKFLILVFVGELVRDFRKWGISGGGKSLSEVEESIKRLKEFFGQDKVGYTYIIINKKNINNYKAYFDGLNPQEMRVRGRLIGGYKLQISLRKMVNEMTRANERYSAIRSKVCSNIVKNLYK